MKTCGLGGLVEEVMRQGLLTSEAMYQIDRLLRQRDYSLEEMNALDTLLQGLIEGRIRSQSPGVNLFLSHT